MITKEVGNELVSFTTEKGKVNTYSTKFRLITMDKVFTPTFIYELFSYNVQYC